MKLQPIRKGKPIALPRFLIIGISKYRQLCKMKFGSLFPAMRGNTK